MRDLDGVLTGLAGSKFRQRFHLRERELGYLRSRDLEADIPRLPGRRGCPTAGPISSPLLGEKHARR
jgi:hypothetical protein